MLATSTPFPQYFDTDGSPLDNGYLFFGVANQNPEIAPVQVYWDAAGTQPAAQPIRTINGYAARSGSPAILYVGSNYSLTVKDKQQRRVYYSANSAEASNDQQLLMMIETLQTDVAARLLKVPTVALLRLFDSTLGTMVYVQQYGAGLSDGGGTFLKDASDVSSPDNGVTTIVAGDGARWKRFFMGGVSPQQAGCVCDGTVDDDVALTRLLAAGVSVQGRKGDVTRFTTPKTFATDKVTIDLGGGTLKPDGVEGDVFTLAAFDFYFRNGTIECSGLDDVDGWAVAADTRQQLNFRDLIIKGGKNGIRLPNCYTCWFDNVQVNGFSGKALDVYSTIPGVPANSLWFTNCSFNNNTTTGSVCNFDTVAGIFVTACSFQANSNAAAEIRIVGTNGMYISESYFETFDPVGAAIYAGDGGPTKPVNVLHVHHNYFQTDKQEIKIGDDVNDLSTVLVFNDFLAVTEVRYAINCPTGFIPDCHSNTGSRGDIDRTFMVGVSFGGGTTGITYDIERWGTYERQGSIIDIDYRVTLTNKGSSTGAALITGIPGIPLTLGQHVVGDYANMTGLGGSSLFGLANEFGNQALSLRTGSATGTVTVTNANFTNTTTLRGSASYRVNAVNMTPAPAPAPGPAPSPTPPPPPPAPSYPLTRSLMHFDVATAWTDHATPTNTWTPYSSLPPTISVSQSVFGGAAANFNGSASGPGTTPCALLGALGGRWDIWTTAAGWTLNMRVRFTSLQPCIFFTFETNSAGGQTPLRIGMTGTNIIVACNGPGGAVDVIQFVGSTTIAINTWYALMVERDGDTIRLYLDGTQDGSQTMAIPGQLLSVPFSQYVYLGAYEDKSPAGSHLALNGWIDEFRLMSQTQVSGGGTYVVEVAAYPNS